MSSGASSAVLDALISSAGEADPYPLYRELLAAGPIHRGGPDGAWYVFGYEACRRVLVDRGCGCRVPADHPPPTAGRLQASMVMHDPPEHARLRRAISWAFTPVEVEPLRNRIVTLTDRALEAMAGKGGGDVIAELAYPLPAAVIGELLGLSPEDADQFQALAALSVAAPRTGDEASLVEQAARDADARLEACFHELIESRRRRPSGDVLGKLVALSDGAAVANGTGKALGSPAALSESELLSTVMLLYIAGVLTTTSFIGNGLLALIAHPEQIRRVRADPSRLPDVVEEVLRWDNPVPVVARNVFEPLAVGGATLQSGDRVVVVLGAGNRDPARFNDPDRFLPGRPDNVPLSFGWGVHRCVGAHLARLEAEVVFGRLLERFAVEPAELDPPRLPGLMIRGPTRLPVHLVPR
ncbi:MAG: cytochrome P450 [Pseudonocardiaceae bacterium]